MFLDIEPQIRSHKFDEDFTIVQSSHRGTNSFDSAFKGSAGAVLSQDLKYRYLLWRRWGEEDSDLACFVMLNPSTADGFEPDPTIRRCIGFARHWGMGGVCVVNMFPLRSPNPKDLISEIDDRDGSPGDECDSPVNAHWIDAAAARSKIVVCAWGAHVTVSDVSYQVKRMLARHSDKMVALGLTKYGHPRHPLYLPGPDKVTPMRFVIDPLGSNQ